MKFMKLGTKADSFQSDGDNIRYVATELATDIVFNVDDVKFHLHKFPLLSKSLRLQKFVAASENENQDEIRVTDIPGGPAAFEICAKFCYGMAVTLNAYNVVAARCAAEYLEMHETVEKGNLVYKIEAFLRYSIFRSWKDSIIVLQATRSLMSQSEELKLMSRCIDSIASKSSMETSKVVWSYTYNRKKLVSDNGVRRSKEVPNDWWVEDLCDLHIDLYKRVIWTIKTQGRVSSEMIGEALHAYARRRIPGFSKGLIQFRDLTKYRLLTKNILQLLPPERGSGTCGFLIKLLRTMIVLGFSESERKELIQRIGEQLESASVGDLLIQIPSGRSAMYDVDIVQSLVDEFVAQDRRFKYDDSSRAGVARLIDAYLAEIGRVPDTPLLKFLGLAEAVSTFPRQSHDGVYRAIDMFLKQHPGITKSERKRICRLMDCRKLSAEACAHAVQNERLPLRVVVQVLFFEQARTENNTAKQPGPALPGGSLNSSRSATDEYWDSLPNSEEIKALRAKLADLQISKGERSVVSGKTTTKGLDRMAMSRMFSKLLAGKEQEGEVSSSSDTSSPRSANGEETKTIPSTSRGLSRS